MGLSHIVRGMFVSPLRVCCRMGQTQEGHVFYSVDTAVAELYVLTVWIDNWALKFGHLITAFDHKSPPTAQRLTVCPQMHETQGVH
jgi:hypothetical protein